MPRQAAAPVTPVNPHAEIESATLPANGTILVIITVVPGLADKYASSACIHGLNASADGDSTVRLVLPVDGSPSEDEIQRLAKKALVAADKAVAATSGPLPIPSYQRPPHER